MAPGGDTNYAGGRPVWYVDHLGVSYYSGLEAVKTRKTTAIDLAKVTISLTMD